MYAKICLSTEDFWDFTAKSFYSKSPNSINYCSGFGYFCFAILININPLCSDIWPNSILKLQFHALIINFFLSSPQIKILCD